MPWLVVVNTILSIVNLVVVSYNELGYLSASTDLIYRVELFVGILFCTEFVYNFFMDEGGFI